MKVFILKTILFACIACSIFFGIAYHYKQPINLRNDYMAAIIDKHNKLENDKNHRIILAGGSNIAFGINSQKIEKELKMPVTNLGLHGGLGLQFILNEIIETVKTGDIILLNLEYSLYDQNYKPNIELLNQTQIIYPKSRSYYTFQIDDKLFIYYKNFKKSFTKPKADTTSIYNRKSFNIYGDITKTLNTNNTLKISGEGKLNEITALNGLMEFKTLSNTCKKVGAKLYFVFPCYLNTEYELNKDRIKNIELLLKRDLSFIYIINKPETFVYEQSYFFDSCYHLNEKGKQKRTDTLISILKKII